MMSNRIELGTAEMIRVALSQQESTYRGKPEHAGLMVALDIVMRFCAIPMADAAIAQAMRVVGKTASAPAASAGSRSARRIVRSKTA